LSEGTESGLVSDEGLPLTRFGGLSVTVDLGSERRLVPVDGRRSISGVSVELELTGESLGDKLNDTSSSSVFLTVLEFLTEVAERELEGKLEIGRSGKFTHVSALESVGPICG
jgi:hypothetical protein